MDDKMNQDKLPMEEAVQILAAEESQKNESKRNGLVALLKEKSTSASDV